MNVVKVGEAVAIAIKSSDSDYEELTIEEFKENPLHLVMGKLKAKKENLYTVDILNNWYGIQGQVVVKQSALGIPIECKVNNVLGIEVTAYGVVKWGTDFSTDDIEAYTDLGVKEVISDKIIRIKSWI